MHLWHKSCAAASHHKAACTVSRSKLAAAVVACAIGLVNFSSSASATTISETSAADDWFTADPSFTTFALSGTPTDGFLRTFGATYVDRSALEFSLAGISAGATINSATFSVSSGGTEVAGGTFNFWGYSGDGAITVADATQTADLLTTLPTLTGHPTYTVDVTSLIQTLVDASAGYAGILITVSPEGNFFGNDLVSSEGDNGPVPNLTVDFSVPEPMSTALLGVGLAGLGMIRRRRG